MDTRAIVILYDGNKIQEKSVVKLAQLLRKEGVTVEENVSISILDQDDIAATLAKSKVDNTIVFKEVVEKSPVEQSLIYLSGLYGKTVWQNPILLGIHLSKNREVLNPKTKTALRILCKEEVSAELALKYGFTLQHLTAIQSVVTLI